MFDLKAPKTENLPPIRCTPAERKAFEREAKRRNLTPTNLLRLAVGELLTKSMGDPKGDRDAR